MGRPVHRLVDLWHLLEKLGIAAKVLYGDEEASAQLGKWRLSLLNGRQRGGADSQDACGQSKESVRIGDSRPCMKPSPTLKSPRGHAVCDGATAPACRSALAT